MDGKAAGGSRRKTSLRNTAEGEGMEIVGEGKELCLFRAKNCL
jgi:hypothetical protein